MRYAPDTIFRGQGHSDQKIVYVTRQDPKVYPVHTSNLGFLPQINMTQIRFGRMHGQFKTLGAYWLWGHKNLIDKPMEAAILDN